MKKIYLTMLVAIATFIGAKAQSNSSVDAQVGKIAASVVAYKPATFLEAAKALKPIVKENPDYWIPAYYEALFEINYAINAPKSADAEETLEDVKDKLDRLMTLADADKSEIYTLYGMRNAASGKYGNAIASEVAGNYFKAILLNPMNPRPWLMLMIYSRQIWGAKDYDCSMEMNLIRGILDKQQINGLAPSWGKSMITQD